MPLTVKQHINAPIEAVFDFITDDEKRHRWMIGLGESVYPDDYDPANPVGTKFKQTIAEGGHDTTYEGEIIAHEPPRYFVIELGKGSFRSLAEYELAVDPTGGCDVTHRSVIVSDKWWIQLIGKLAQGMTLKIMQRHMTELKKVVEEASNDTGTAD